MDKKLGVNSTVNPIVIFQKAMYCMYIVQYVIVMYKKWRSQILAFILFYCVDQKHYYYLHNDESFSFCDCYLLLGGSSLLLRMGKCQER